MRWKVTERDVLVLQQYAGVFRSARSMPEKRLFAAVLMSAITDFEEVADSSKRRDDPQFQKLRSWFLSSDTTWPFSFENVCQNLELDAGCIRARLAELISDGRKRRRSGARGPT